MHDEAAEFAVAVGQRLRAKRLELGLSLHDVEVRSRGRLKGGSAGSYERASRALTITRLYEIASLYGVPIADLLPGSQSDNEVAEILAEALDGELPAPYLHTAVTALAPVVTGMLQEARRGAG